MTRRLTDQAFNDTQHLDLYLADQPGQPLVVCIHGGGFISGDKDDERCKQSISLLTEAGFNCASITYSLATPDNRFAMWPRNLYDVADALAWLHDRSAEYAYDFSHFGMLGFSAGCCLANLYIQGGETLFDHFAYQTRVFRPAALAGFYGPYDFSTRQPGRRSENHQINRYHSPSYWLRLNNKLEAPPVLHIQGDRDKVVFSDQHHAFQKDYEDRGYDFKAVIVEGFGHSFSPRDANMSGKNIDLRMEIQGFFSRHLSSRSEQ